MKGYAKFRAKPDMPAKMTMGSMPMKKKDMMFMEKVGKAVKKAKKAKKKRK